MAPIPTTTIPPVSPYGILQGTLFQYYQTSLAAFETFPQRPKKCILLGGLSDGLMPVPFTTPLANLCHECGWSMVQPITSSSYLGFGHGTLERDSEELSALMYYLTCHHDAESFFIVGHSTGCQNAIHFLKYGRDDMVQRTKLVVLQAPVSDREDAESKDIHLLHQHLEHARALQEQVKQQQQQQHDEDDDNSDLAAAAMSLSEMMPRSAFWAPITAQRFLDLFDKGGADDFFSSDFTDQELQDRLDHVSYTESLQAVLVAYSGADEYVPSHVDTRRLTERLCRAMNRYRQVAIPLYLECANHNLSKDEQAIPTFLDRVRQLLQQIS